MRIQSASVSMRKKACLFSDQCQLHVLEYWPHGIAKISLRSIISSDRNSQRFTRWCFDRYYSHHESNYVKNKWGLMLTRGGSFWLSLPLEGWSPLRMTYDHLEVHIGVEILEFI
ncbi:uncharacterized protein LOC102678837 [Apis dorsata]|uniref:uncharacterized protein LOC102678837 n=1 Tax=Apis dorsata TaxID=7462 RepID=UPI0003DF802B|nr:uncharacterized protein LOC102678837 [Apis dorsata]